MKQFTLIALAIGVCPSVLSQQPLLQTEACKRFSDAVVSVKTERMLGTGFIISSDGWIVTAAHVVIDPKTRKEDLSIMVTLPGKQTAMAAIIPNPDHLSNAVDFALLKVDRKDLPFLEFAESSEVVAGQSLTVIGFPFSARGANGNKFCLSVLATTAGIPTEPYIGDVIYFQGPSIKGLSGSPLISLNSGKVVAILDTTLAGITIDLEIARDNLKGGEVIRITGNDSDIGFGKTTRSIIDTLDSQLANGLGAAIESTDAAYALKKAKQQKTRKK